MADSVGLVCTHPDGRQSGALRFATDGQIEAFLRCDDWRRRDQDAPGADA